MTTNTTTTQIEDLNELLDENLVNGWADLLIGPTGEIVKEYSSGINKTIAPNIGAYMDHILMKTKNQVLSIVDSAELLSTPHALPSDRIFWNFWDLYNKLNAPQSHNNFEIIASPGSSSYPSTHPQPSETIHYFLNEYFTLQGNPSLGTNITDVTISSDKQNISYKIWWVEQPPVEILFLAEYLYLSRKIEIWNLSQVAAKCLRAQQREERRAEKAMRNWNSVTWIPENPSTIPGVPNSANTLNEELSIPQLYAACEQAQKKWSSSYSFWGKWYYVRYEKTGFPASPAWAFPAYWASKFHIQVQEKNGTGIVAVNTIGEAIAEVSTRIQKKESQKEFAETIDMGDNFSRTEFTKLCEWVSESKGKRWEYKLKGKSYFVHEKQDTSHTPPISFNPRQYTVSFPGKWWIETTGDHLHLDDNLRRNEQPTTQNLIEFLEGHHGIYDPHHDLDRKDLLETISKLGGIVGKEHKVYYIINGHKYWMWSKRKTGKMTYYAEVPNGEHGKKTVSAWTQKWLYDKIVESMHGWHENTEKHEGKEQVGHNHEKWHDDSHEGGHGHDTKDTWTLYDRGVGAVFGHGLLGKAFLGARNIIPKPIRSLTGATTKSGITAGVVGWVLYGWSLALWSAALSSVIVPAMTLTFTASMANKFLKWRKWWPHNKSEDDHGGHGHGHWGGH